MEIRLWLINEHETRRFSSEDAHCKCKHLLKPSTAKTKRNRLRTPIEVDLGLTLELAASSRLLDRWHSNAPYTRKRRPHNGLDLSKCVVRVVQNEIQQHIR